jgi:hypothetical protein
MSDEQKAREARGNTHLNDARDARFATTGEPGEAPDHDDAQKERAVTASKGSKSSGKK